jgi:hypothetical protein
MCRSVIRVGLAAVVATVALASAFAAGATTTPGQRADGLRYQAEAHAYFQRLRQASRNGTAAGIRADGLRYQAEARAYFRRLRQASRAETAAGIRADGLRYQAEARFYLLRSKTARSHRTLPYALIVSGLVVAAVGLLFRFKLKPSLARTSPATGAGGES